MTRFNQSRDQLFFNSINDELINRVIETEVVLYKTIIDASNPDDIYGESPERSYYVGTSFNCIISRDNADATTDEFGQNVSQNIILAINREFIKEKGVYPENGDVFMWHDFYYEIDNVIENQYIAGRKEINWSFVCNAHLSNMSQINILPRNK